MHRNLLKLGKRISLFFVFIILINLVLATQTEEDDNYKVTSLVASGITTDYDDIRFSSVTAEIGIGNYSDIQYLMKNGILYVLNLIDKDTTPPQITASGPSGTISTPTITLQVTTNENAMCRYMPSTEGNISVNYTDMPYDFSGNALQHSTTMTLANGYYEFYARCIDYLGNVMNQSETISFTVDVTVTTPPAVTPSGGRGGGSITRAKPIPNLMVDIDLLSISIQQGESQIKVIRIVNIGNTNLEVVDIDLGELEKFIVLDEESFSLRPGEIKKIKLNVFAEEGELPDSYIGSITVRSEGITKKIKTIIEIKEKKPLFDLTTKVIEKRLKPGDDVRATMSMLNLGDLEHIDVLLHYAIRDFDGNVLNFKEESLAIDEKLDVTGTLEIPRDLPDDYYVFYSKISYGNVVASSIDTFEVVRGTEFLGPGYARLSIIIIILCIIALIIFFLLRFMKKRGVDISWKIKELYWKIWPAKYEIKTYGYKIKTYGNVKASKYSKAKPPLTLKTKPLLPFKATPLLPITIVLIILVVSTFSLIRSLQPVGLAPSIPELISLEESYIDSVNLTVSESGEYIWAMGNYGNIKSIRFDGTIGKDNYARIFLEHENRRYLIFDSLKLSGTDELINFRDVCVDTCLLPGFNQTLYKLVVFIEDGSLTIDNVKYGIEKD